VVVTVKELATPSVNVTLLALVMVGARFTTCVSAVAELEAKLALPL
jgi:hypothetical protein